MKSFLVSNGVEAKFTNEDSVGWTGRYGQMTKGVQLKVPRAQLAHAEQLLLEADQGHSEELDADLEALAAGELEDYEAAPEPVAPPCESCGSAETSRADSSSLWMGLRRLFLGPEFVCGSCGWRWR